MLFIVDVWGTVLLPPDMVLACPVDRVVMFAAGGAIPIAACMLAYICCNYYTCCAKIITTVAKSIGGAGKFVGLAWLLTLGCTIFWFSYSLGFP